MTTNPVIEFKDYKKIGTMETALSEHADEAFNELSEPRQKLAEKIFKCLTETDRENRVIRRATDVEKLCAVAGADLADVVAVIEAFRKEGRTFLMPPPEIPLNKRSLIDISHESLIRKWERLTKWVEEEGQSAQLYRRLAEDALLNLGGKVGFWSEPELSEALDWREDFKPNETWAELYREKGERQYKASFEDSMKYLEASRENRDAEVAEDERQQNALRKYARNLRSAFIVLIFVVLATIGVAAFAWQQRNAAIETQTALAEEKKNTDDLNGKLEVEKQNLQSKTVELDESLEKQKEATEKAEEEKERADSEAERATLSEAETQKALEQQKRLAAEARAAEQDAKEKQRIAEIAKQKAEATTAREEYNRRALTALEQGEYVQALSDFQSLLKSYENEKEEIEPAVRTQGKWWASHNLGIVNTKINIVNEKMNTLKEAENYYKKALGHLGEQPEPEIGQGEDFREYFRQVSFRDDAAVNRSKIATLRRLAQLYRSQVETSLTAEEWQKFTLLSVKRYTQLIELMKAERFSEPLMADVYVELADAYANSYDTAAYTDADLKYEEAADIYERTRDFAKEVVVLKKMADLSIYRQASVAAIKALKIALKIQEDKNGANLSPVKPEIADTYDRIAKVIEIDDDTGNFIEGVPAEDYAAVARLIDDFNFKSNIKTTEFNAVVVRNLADAYVKVHRCDRAEAVYDLGIDTASQKQVEYFQNRYIYFELLSEAGHFYQNVKRDDKKALEYFDKFLEYSEKNKVYEQIESGTWGDFLNGDSFENAADFYAARGNFETADKLYKAALEIAKTKYEMGRSRFSDPGLKYLAAQGEVLVKRAELYEKQNKPTEAEAAYKEALETAPLGVRDWDIRYALLIARARILIRQADFYDRRGNKEKTLQIYTWIKDAFNADRGSVSVQQVAAFNDELSVLGGIVYKRLGDLSRSDPKIAGEFYSTAALSLERIENSTSKDKYSRYYKNSKLNAKYYGDLAELYEAWVSLGVTQDWQKARAEGVRKKANELKLEEEKPPCAAEDEF